MNSSPDSQLTLSLIKEDKLESLFGRSLLNNQLSNSVFENISVLNQEKIEWAYREMLQMRYCKSQILSILKSPEMNKEEQKSPEEILNFLIDKCLDKEELNANQNFLSNIQNQDNINFKSINQSLNNNSSKLNQNLEDINSIISINNHEFNENEEEEKKEEKCPICLFRIDKIIIVPKCFHKYCEECIFEYIKSEITTKGIQLNLIKCPYKDCLHILEDETLEKILIFHQDLFLKYKKFQLQTKTLKNPLMRQCIGFNCDKFIKKSRWSNKMKCSCGQQMCYKCRSPWHGNLACTDFIEDKFAEYERKKGLKKCPMCNIYIDKNEGCNHMTCFSCKWEFCWICSGEWNKKTGYCPNGCQKFPGGRNRLIIDEYEENNIDLFNNNNEHLVNNSWYYNLMIVIFQIIIVVPYIFFIGYMIILYLSLFLIWIAVFKEMKRKLINDFRILKNGAILCLPFVFIFFFYIDIFIFIVLVLINFSLCITASLIRIYAIWIHCTMRKNNIFCIYKTNFKIGFTILPRFGDYDGNLNDLSNYCFIFGTGLTFFVLVITIAIISICLGNN